MYKRQQISKGLNFKSYIKRTDGFDVPRLDYSGGASCPTLLLEPQRTNKSNNSEDWTATGYIKNNCTAIANQTTSQDNNQTADQLDFGSGSGFFYEVVTTITAASTYSVFVKYIDYQYIKIIGTGDVDHYANFDIQNGIVGNTGSQSTASIEDYGNGWYRCIINYNSGTFAGGARLYKTTSLTAGLASGGGDAGSFYFWGNQMEVGTFHTSYIPTTGTSVTRVGDLCVATSVTDLIGQTEGVVNLKFQKEYTDTYRIFTLYGTNTSNRLGIFTINNNLYVFVVSGGVLQFQVVVKASMGNGTFNIAVQYKQNDYKIYVNGVSEYTNTSANVPVYLIDVLFAQLQNGALSFNHKINYLYLFKETLTDTELEELTTI